MLVADVMTYAHVVPYKLTCTNTPQTFPLIAPNYLCLQLSHRIINIIK